MSFPRNLRYRALLSARSVKGTSVSVNKKEYFSHRVRALAAIQPMGIMEHPLWKIHMQGMSDTHESLRRPFVEQSKECVITWVPLTSHSGPLHPIPSSASNALAARIAPGSRLAWLKLLLLPPSCLAMLRRSGQGGGHRERRTERADIAA